MRHVLSLAQVGIRSLRSAGSEIQDSIDDGNRVMTMGEFRAVGPKGVAEVVPRDARTYVSIDIDVLDLPLIPGCVSAEPNGMSYAELRDTLVAIAEHCEVVGLDLVEVNPTLDVGTGVTSYLAAHTVLEFPRQRLPPATLGAAPRGPRRGTRLTRAGSAPSERARSASIA